MGSGSVDTTLRIWDAQNGAAIGQPLIGHTNAISAASYSPDGGKIVSGSVDGTLQIWDARAGQQIGEPLRGHSDWVNCVAYHPDGSRSVSGSDDKTVRTWDAQTGAPVGEPLRGRRGVGKSVAYTPDGSKIVPGYLISTVQIWGARTGSAIGVIPRGEGRWDSDQECFLSIPSWRPKNDALIRSDAPTQVPNDGWLRTLDGNLFLWIPPKYREDICCRDTLGKIAPRLKFDWKSVPHGKDWTKIKEILEEGTEQ